MDSLAAVPSISVLGPTPVHSPEHSSDEDSNVDPSNVVVDQPDSNDTGTKILQPTKVDQPDESRETDMTNTAENGADDITEEQQDDENDNNDVDNTRCDEEVPTKPEQEENDDEDIAGGSESNGAESSEPHDDTLNDEGDELPNANTAKVGEETIKEEHTDDEESKAVSGSGAEISIDSGIASFAATSTMKSDIDTTIEGPLVENTHAVSQDDDTDDKMEVDSIEPHMEDAGDGTIETQEGEDAGDGTIEAQEGEDAGDGPIETQEGEDAGGESAEAQKTEAVGGDSVETEKDRAVGEDSVESQNETVVKVDGTEIDNEMDSVPRQPQRDSDDVIDTDSSQPQRDTDDVIDFTIDTDEYATGTGGLPPQLGNFMFLSGMPPWGQIGGMSPMGNLLADIMAARMEEEDEEDADKDATDEKGKRRLKRESSDDTSDGNSLEEQQEKWHDLMKLLEEQHQQQLLMQQQQHDQQLKMISTQVDQLAKRRQRRKEKQHMKVKIQSPEKDKSVKDVAADEEKEGDVVDMTTKEEGNQAEEPDTEVKEDITKAGGDRHEEPQRGAVKTNKTGEKETKDEVVFHLNSSEDSDCNYWRSDELPANVSTQEQTTPVKDDQTSPTPILHRSMSSPTSLSEAFLNSSQRLTLREKHARHMADLKAYYEAEITELKEQLNTTTDIKSKSPYRRLERNNAKLKERCERLEIALKSANSRIEELESTVLNLQIQVTDGAERFDISSGTSKALEQRIDNLKLYCKQKDAQLQRADRRNRDLEASLQEAYRLQDEQATRTDSKSQEMLEKLMVEYEALGKEHDNTKLQLTRTETDLYDSKSEIANLKRTISKLELEVKRIDHENTIMRESGLSPTISLSRLKERLAETKSSTNSTRTCRKWLQSSVDYNMFTGEDKTLDKSDLNSSLLNSSRLSTGGLSSRDVSGNLSNSFLRLSNGSGLGRPESPMIRAAAQLDKWKSDERQHKISPRKTSPSPGSYADLTPTYAMLPDTHTTTSPRSTSLNRTPPRSSPSSSTRTQSSPAKPRANPALDVSPRFKGLIEKKESNTTRFDVNLNDVDRPVKDASPRKVDSSPARDWLIDSHSPNTTARSAVSTTSPTPRNTQSNLRRSPKVSPVSRLDFSGLSLADGPTTADSVLDRVKTGVYCSSPVTETRSKRSPNQSRDAKSAHRSETEIRERIKSIRETERKLDELIEEKRQLESALSRIPNTGPRATPQSRREQEQIEDRLDQIASELGTIRMTLRRYHVIKT